jgi:hypothetical protein
MDRSIHPLAKKYKQLLASLLALMHDLDPSPASFRARA